MHNRLLQSVQLTRMQASWASHACHISLFCIRQQRSCRHAEQSEGVQPQLPAMAWACYRASEASEASATTLKEQSILRRCASGGRGS